MSAGDFDQKNSTTMQFVRCQEPPTRNYQARKGQSWQSSHSRLLALETRYMHKSRLRVLSSRTHHPPLLVGFCRLEDSSHATCEERTSYDIFAND